MYSAPLLYSSQYLWYIPKTFSSDSRTLCKTHTDINDAAYAQLNSDDTDRSYLEQLTDVIFQKHLGLSVQSFP